MADEYISREAVINITAETGAWETRNRVRELPTADVQPVKRGKWSECYTDSHHYSGICSVCGRASIKSLTESLYEYCPKCGARMKED